MSSDAFDLKHFWDLICQHGLDKKKIGELTREEVEQLLRDAFECTALDRVPF